MKIVGRHPNTYTFSKALVERILQKIKGNVPVTILRPAVVGASWKDPFKGWVDNFSAGGSLFLLGGLGIVRYLNGRNNMIGDHIPVDIVSDSIIVTAAKYANN